MKNKEEMSREIMNRVIAYEKKKLRIWYEVVLFVLVVVLVSEIWVLFDFFAEMQEIYTPSFWWVMGEDLETMIALSGSIVKILWEELPWMKIVLMVFVSTTFLGCVKYTFQRSKTKKTTSRQISKYETDK